MARVIASFSVVPLGTEGTSLSSYIAAGLSKLEEANVEYTLTPMATIIEGDSLSEIFHAVELVEERVMEMGVERVVTHVEIDDRVDTSRKPEEKVKSVKEKLIE